MKALPTSVVVLGLSFFWLGSAHAGDCPAPNPDASGLFSILQGSSPVKLTDIKAYFGTRSVASDSLNTDCETPLLLSIRDHEYDVFYYLYATYNKPDVNAKTNQVVASVYEYGLQYGNWELVTFLKQQGGNAGGSELEHAIDGNNVDVLRSLIQAGAAVNRPNSDGRPALLYAAQNSASIDVINLLIQSKADIDQTDNNGETALCSAAHGDTNVEVTKALIQAGADVNHADSGGQTALLFAAYGNTNVEVTEALIPKSDINHADYNHHTALYYAEDKGGRQTNPDVGKAIIRAGGHK